MSGKLLWRYEVRAPIIERPIGKKPIDLAQLRETLIEVPTLGQ